MTLEVERKPNLDAESVRYGVYIAGLETADNVRGLNGKAKSNVAKFDE